MRTSFSTSTGLCQVATHEMSPSQWGHQKTGRGEHKIKQRSCRCGEKLPPELSCGGLDYTPYSRAQKYRPECSKNVHEHMYGSGSWKKEAKRRENKVDAHKRKHRAPQVRKLQLKSRLESREKQYVCQSCYNIPHAECRGTVLAVSVSRPRTPTKFGCPECDQPRFEEKLERPSAMISNAALALTQ